MKNTQTQYILLQGEGYTILNKEELSKWKKDASVQEGDRIIKIGSIFKAQLKGKIVFIKEELKPAMV